MLEQTCFLYSRVLFCEYSCQTELSSHSLSFFLHFINYKNLPFDPHILLKNKLFFFVNKIKYFLYIFLTIFIHNNNKKTLLKSAV